MELMQPLTTVELMAAEPVKAEQSELCEPPWLLVVMVVVMELMLQTEMQDTTVPKVQLCMVRALRSSSMVVRVGVLWALQAEDQELHRHGVERSSQRILVQNATLPSSRC